MPQLIRSFNSESFSLLSRKTAITYGNTDDYGSSIIKTQYEEHLKIKRVCSVSFLHQLIEDQVNVTNRCSQINYVLFIYMVDGLVIYAKDTAFKAKAKNSRPRPDSPKAKAKKYGLKAKD